jgi:CRISPR-associated protein Cas4
MEDEDDLLPISALQHLVFCPRQCALIHIEREWAENRLTAEGGLLHARVQSGETTTRGALRVLRALPLVSHRLGLTGYADVVEIHRAEGGGERAFPVEYKRGTTKAHDADRVQLCAQALCIEELHARRDRSLNSRVSQRKDDLSRLRPRRHGLLRRTSRRRVPGCRALSLSGFGDVSSQFASTTCRSASRRRGRAALGRRRIVEGSLGAVGDGRSIKKEGRQKRRPQWAPAVVLSGVQFEG